MARYDTRAIVKNKSGVREQKTTMYPKIEPQADDIYITADRNVRLDNLAARHYNDPSLWWVIAVANNINGSIYPEPGQRIRIPQNIQSILSEYRELNENR